MKKLTVIILVAATITACNNSAEGDKKTDSATIQDNTRVSTDTKGDTSSYDRMSNKTSDSTQQ
jgi:hypothetical protein